MGLPERPNWRQVAEAAKRRRAELGLRQEDVIARMEPPVGIETLRRVEAGDQRTYRLTTLAAVSKALGWPANTLADIAYNRQLAAADETLIRRLDAVEERLKRIETVVDQQLAELEADRVP